MATLHIRIDHGTGQNQVVRPGFTQDDYDKCAAGDAILLRVDTETETVEECIGDDTWDELPHMDNPGD